MNALVPAPALDPTNRLFIDIVAKRQAAWQFFMQPPDGFAPVAARQTAHERDRPTLSRLLCAYSERIGASATTMASAAALADPDVLCVVTGQQAGFLGGPCLTAYKILHAIRLAKALALTLKRPVVPVFWLASEDHDLDEIRHLRLPAADGSLRTVSFDWDGRGAPIERMPITTSITDAATAALSGASAVVRSAFSPGRDDDYASWHARIWARLFGDDGLVVAEPRIVRPLAGRTFEATCRLDRTLRPRLRETAESLQGAGYTVPLDISTAARLFELRPRERRRIADPDAHADRAASHPELYSPDAALRPVVTDAVFPTVANVLGPGELAYHVLLQPLYRLLGVPQPVPVPRHGYTVVGTAEGLLLDRLGLSAEQAVSPDLDMTGILHTQFDPTIDQRFDAVAAAVRTQLAALRDPLAAVDRALEARQRQTADRIATEIDRLRSRAHRADLGRRGISTSAARRLAALLRPTGRLQERVLSLPFLLQRFAVHCLHALPAADPTAYAHTVVALRDDDGGRRGTP